MFEVSKDDEVLIELTQKMQRLPGIDRETIGFTILQVLHYYLLVNHPLCHFHTSATYDVSHFADRLTVTYLEFHNSNVYNNLLRSLYQS